VTKQPFEQALVRKSGRALKVAGLALNAGDFDSAVSRSYYAMFDIARAALLRAGVTEDNLPRTHNGVIEAFRKHTVQTGQIDRQLATHLTRIESLRIKADYTGTEIELAEAADVVAKAELFVQTVERVFSFSQSSSATEYQSPAPQDDDQVSEPGFALPEVPKKGCNARSHFLGRDSPTSTRKLVAVAAAEGPQCNGRRPVQGRRPRQ